MHDGYISDLIGTHFRHDYVYPLSDYIDGEGQNVTLPTLDLPDFIGTSFTTAPDGKLCQLPDQQFANLPTSLGFRACYYSIADVNGEPELGEVLDDERRIGSLG